MHRWCDFDVKTIYLCYLTRHLDGRVNNHYIFLRQNQYTTFSSVNTTKFFSHLVFQGSNKFRREISSNEISNCFLPIVHVPVLPIAVLTINSFTHDWYVHILRSYIIHLILWYYYIFFPNQSDFYTSNSLPLSPSLRILSVSSFKNLLVNPNRGKTVCLFPRCLWSLEWVKLPPFFSIKNKQRRQKVILYFGPAIVYSPFWTTEYCWLIK